MTKTLLAYGDSNTHGYPPMHARGAPGRFGPDTRWPAVLGAALGTDWSVIEEGLPGRTTGLDDPVMGRHMNGQDGPRIALGCHRPVDLLLIMLGTNDCKTRFNPSAAKITAGAAGLLDIALHPEMQALHGGFDMLLICPPPVLERGCLATEFFGAEAVGPLAEGFAALARAKGARFFNAGDVIESSALDGVHFEAEAHRALGAALAGVIATNP
ncbi:SGNH/GDSL hydrolase family protein [Primorskyibacter aestuariivivens]|uniref:SGNH/GDSL hydrolase family protein n=1 Tax=Primorskyibacter aestuariivivens TaxID=1888912 RepID=UPI0023009E7A|nr:SGNH/GDSL hydrolase family protein [Primorskyibacter aestuariivivens]MDA7427790.1 SGNH/GDSL hydrolase family protein [Primorskyibacter aestuariivivens]